jgi:hypothetical protein
LHCKERKGIVPHNVQTACGVHSVACPINIKVTSPEVSSRSVKINIHLYLVLGLIMRGVISLLRNTSSVSIFGMREILPYLFIY